MINFLKVIHFKSGWTIFFFFLFAGSIASSQETEQKLSLQEAIDTALLHNKDIHIAELDERIAASRFKETKAIFLPRLNFSYTALRSDNPLNVFGFKLQQQSVTQADFDPKLLNHPHDASDFTTQLQLQQPVLNISLNYMRKAAAAQAELYKLKNLRAKDYLVFEVQKAYIQLQLAYSAVKVMEEALATAQAMYNFTSNRVEEGLLQKSDALNVKVQVSTIESSLAEAKSNIRNISDYLGQLMGKTPGTIYITGETIQQESNNLIANYTISSGRTDLLAMQKAVDASAEMIRSLKLSRLPKLNAFATYQLNDNAALKFGSNSYIAGLQLSWDIFNSGSTKHKITAQTLENSKLREQLNKDKESGQAELNKSIRQFADAQYKITRHKTAVESAAEALRILQDRYQQGLVNTTDVLIAQTQLSQQKLAFAQAVFENNITAAYISFLTKNTD